MSKTDTDSIVRSAIEPVYSSAIYSGVYAIGSPIYSAVGSPIYSAVYSGVYTHIYSAVELAINSAVHRTVNSNVYWGVDVSLAIEREIYE